MEMKQHLEKQIKDLLLRGFEIIRDFNKNFQSGLQMDWDYQNLNLSIYQDENLAKPQMQFNSALNLI